MPNDLLGPNPEEVQLWLRFLAAQAGGKQAVTGKGYPCGGRLGASVTDMLR